MEKQASYLMQDQTRLYALFSNTAREEHMVWHKPVSVSEPFRMHASLWGGLGIVPVMTPSNWTGRKATSVVY